VNTIERPRRPEDVDDFVERLTAELAHELRTPLTAIVGFAELLRIRPEDEEVRRDAPVFIQRAAEELLAKLDDLL
jgi:signal transduction histidine kinase